MFGAKCFVFLLLNSIILFWDERAQAKIRAQFVKEGNFYHLIEIPTYKYHYYKFWAHKEAMDGKIAEIKQLKQDKSMSSGFINFIGSREVGAFFFRKLIMCVTYLAASSWSYFCLIPFFFQSFLFKMNIDLCHRRKKAWIAEAKRRLLEHFHH